VDSPLLRPLVLLVLDLPVNLQGPLRVYQLECQVVSHRRSPLVNLVRSRLACQLHSRLYDRVVSHLVDLLVNRLLSHRLDRLPSLQAYRLGNQLDTHHQGLLVNPPDNLQNIHRDNPQASQLDNRRIDLLGNLPASRLVNHLVNQRGNQRRSPLDNRLNNQLGNQVDNRLGNLPDNLQILLLCNRLVFLQCNPVLSQPISRRHFLVCSQQVIPQVYHPDSLPAILLELQHLNHHLCRVAGRPDSPRDNHLFVRRPVQR